MNCPMWPSSKLKPLKPYFNDFVVNQIKLYENMKTLCAKRKQLCQYLEPWNNTKYEHDKNNKHGDIFTIQLHKTICTEQKKRRKLHMHIQYKFSRNRNNIFAFCILWLNAEIYSKLWKWISWRKARKLKSTDQFDSRRGKNLKCKFEVHFKGPKFAQVINSCANFIS